MKPDSHYFDPPQVPPDEEEPPPPTNPEAEKPAQEMDPGQVEVKMGSVGGAIPVEPKETGNKKGKKKGRKRAATTPTQAPVREVREGLVAWLIIIRDFPQGCESSAFNLISDYCALHKPNFQTSNALKSTFSGISDYFRLFLTDALTPVSHCTSAMRML